MMETITRVVAFDDQPADLDALVDCLNRAGIPSVGIPFQKDHDAMGIMAAPHVRVVFMDVNLLSIPETDSPQNHGVIGSLLTTLAPAGPYLLVLWTATPTAVQAVRAFLDERLVDIAKPFDVVPLAKESYISSPGNLTDRDGLINAVKGLTESTPSLAVLCRWEEQVFVAAAQTIESIMMLGTDNNTSSEQQNSVLENMYAMAVATVGHQNTSAHGLNALHDALLPILADRINSSTSASANNDIWREAIKTFKGQPEVSVRDAASLHRVYHIAVVDEIGYNQGAERGSVIPFKKAKPDSWFQAVLELDEKDAIYKLFHVKDLDPHKPYPWVLVQAQAACDYAQRQPGPLPFFLGVNVLESNVPRNRRPRQDIWQSPRFNLDDAVHELQVNTRVQIPLAVQAAKKITPLYRLREQLVAHLLHHAQSNNARPGITTFQNRA